MGNGRLKNQCGTNFPMPPTRMARPRTAAPVVFMTSLMVYHRIVHKMRYLRIFGGEKLSVEGQYFGGMMYLFSAI